MTMVVGAYAVHCSIAQKQSCKLESTQCGLCVCMTWFSFFSFTLSTYLHSQFGSILFDLTAIARLWARHVTPKHWLFLGKNYFNWNSVVSFTKWCCSFQASKSIVGRRWMVQRRQYMLCHAGCAHIIHFFYVICKLHNDIIVRTNILIPILSLSLYLDVIPSLNMKHIFE